MPFIHWGYKCNDLKPLFKYVRPEQWIIDLIPIGDNRDASSAIITAKGEIDEIDISGKNHPRWGKKSNFYKDGRSGVAGSEERKRWELEHNRKSTARTQSRPRKEFGNKSYRHVYYKKNKERLDEMMNKSNREYTCIRKIEKLVNISNNYQAGVLYNDTDLYILLEIEKILDYMVKHHINPEIFMSYDLFEKVKNFSHVVE